MSMNRKKFRCALVLGRFQCFHLGHQAIIDKALSVAKQVVVLVGSSDKSGTPSNPFTYELRADMIKAVYDDRVSVYPLPDAGLGNVPAWGDYVLKSCEKYGFTPDVMVTGAEAKYDLWFLHHPGFEVISIDRGGIDISGTALRSSIMTGDRELFEQYTDKKLWSCYDKLSDILINIKNGQQ